MRYIITVALLFLLSSMLSSQVYIDANLSGNYWKHTELYGARGGMGLTYSSNRLSLSLEYSFGYGSYHRFKEFDNINYDYWTTVFVDEDKWQTDLGMVDPSNILKAKSDYGKQNQVSFIATYDLINKRKNYFSIGLGSYVSIVEHFFTFTNIILHDTELIFYEGPLNYIPVSHQKFLTYGALLNINYVINLKNNKLIPFAEFGVGTKYGTYYSLGLKYSTKLKVR